MTSITEKGLLMEMRMDPFACYMSKVPQRGHLRNTPSGEWTFGWTIRNQALASCATLEAAKAMRTRLLAYQKEYYERTA